jgi:hypothetical protein
VDDTLRPYTWYKEFVVRGAEENGLPGAYVAELAALEAVDDPDPARDAKKRTLLLAPRTEGELLESFEARSEPFEPHDVADADAKARPRGRGGS